MCVCAEVFTGLRAWFWAPGVKQGHVAGLPSAGFKVCQIPAVLKHFPQFFAASRIVFVQTCVCVCACVCACVRACVRACVCDEIMF